MRTAFALWVAVLVLAAVPALGAAGRDGVRCVNDLRGDGDDVGEPYADLDDVVQLCTEVQPDDSLLVRLVTDDSADPWSAPAWQRPGAGLFVDLQLSDGRRLDGAFQPGGDRPFELVLRSGDTVACAAPATYDAASDAMVFDAVPASCLGQARVSDVIAAAQVTASYLPDDGAMVHELALPASELDPVDNRPATDFSGCARLFLDTGRHGCGQVPSAPVVTAVQTSRGIPRHPYDTNTGLAPFVVIARDDLFADALAASPFAALGPVLFHSPLTDPGRVPRDTLDEIKRVLPRGGRVYVMGGPAAISQAATDELEALGWEVVRLAGAGRIQTAAAAAAVFRDEFAESMFSDRDRTTAFIVSADNWPDAVVAGQVAPQFGAPVLLTRKDSLPDETRAFLQGSGIDRAFVLGGPAVISEHVVANEINPLIPDGRLFWVRGGAREDTAALMARQAVEEGFRVGFGPYREMVLVNIRGEEGFAHTLALANLNYRTVNSILLPTAGDGGLHPASSEQLCAPIGDDQQPMIAYALDIQAGGGVDLVSDAALAEAEALTAGGCGA